MGKIKVDITDKKAIYVDESRITNRNTKWGIHRTIEEFECEEQYLIYELKVRGYSHLIPLIDNPKYKSNNNNNIESFVERKGKVSQTLYQAIIDSYGNVPKDIIKEKDMILASLENAWIDGANWRLSQLMSNNK